MDNEKQFQGKSYVYINNSRRDLLIILNTHNQGSRYFGYKTISEGVTDVDLLFLVDPYNKYYMDADEGLVYKSLIKLISADYDPECVSIFGTSMAGYGAILFGLQFGFNVIAVNPQINLSSARVLAWPKLKETLGNLDSQINLEDQLITRYSGQSIFLIVGNHPLDVQAFNEFIALKVPNISFIVRKVESKEHKFFMRDLCYLLDIHLLCKTIRTINDTIGE